MERSDPDTTQRTRRAAQLIPAFSRILDIGGGDPALEAALPDGCLYRSCALEGLPGEAPADIVTLFGLLEGLPDPRQTLRALRALDRPLICDYPVIDRGADYDFTPLQALMRAAGFRLRCHVRIDAARAMFKWVPDDGRAIDPPRPPKVLVLSYLNFKNFGDRLGYVVANSLLPAGAIVTHGALNSWTDTGLAYDLVILGTGHSLNAGAILRPEIQHIVETTPHSLGIFGTQYRSQYRRPDVGRAFDALLERMTTWWARYEDDINAFGRGRSNVRHLGDWLISAFPLSVPSFDKTLTIPADIVHKEAPLDRVTQQIQAYRRVISPRIHTLLCALASAEEVAYQEQRETQGHDEESGKFRGQLQDIFGRTFDEGAFFKVDRDAVLRYKLMVEANMAMLRGQICELLNLPSGERR